MADASEAVAAGGRGLRDAVAVHGEEVRRRNASALAVDVLYVFTTAFLATLAVRGFWPAAIAAAPLATFLYFAWKATRPFFLANLLAAVLVAVAGGVGIVP